MEPDTLELPSGHAHRHPATRRGPSRPRSTWSTGRRTTTLGAADLRARYATEGLVKRWTIERIAVATPWGAASGTGAIDATKPFRLDVKLTAEGTIDGVPYHAPLVATGTLSDLSATSDFTVSDPSRAPLAGHADIHMLPFRAQPVDAANLHVAGIAPKRWKADLPEADVTIDASIKPLDAPLAMAGSNPFAGTLRVVNAQPGPIDRDRIPVAAIDADVRGDSRSRSPLRACGPTSGRRAGSTARATMSSPTAARRRSTARCGRSTCARSTAS